MSTTAIVLAGGKSSRMGTPKALLPFDDRPLIVHVVDTLSPLCDDVVVVAAPDQELPSLPVTLVRDEVAHQGPVGGIVYGLNAARGEVAFVTACDCAFLNPALILDLLSRAADYDVVVPYWQGRYQPLHAVYRCSVLPVLRDQLAQGDLRPVHLFDKVRTRRVDEDEIRRCDPEGASFFNMNTPEDYAEALTRWRVARQVGGTAAPAPGSCTVELFGVARMLAQRSDVSLRLPVGATYADVFAALAREVPALTGRVINAEGTGLIDGYACSIGGLRFVRTATAKVTPGESLIILSADAGG